MIHSIFFDIDGTLVSFKTHTIPESTLAAIRRARKKGIRIFIATGRPQYFINNLDGLEYDGIVMVNGAVCKDSKGNVLYSDYVSQSDLQSLVEYHKSNPFPITFATSEGLFATAFSKETDEVFSLLNVGVKEVRPIEYVLGKNVEQIIAFFPEERQEEVMTNALPGCDTMRWHPFFTDIIARNNSKSHGIQMMLDHYGLPLEGTVAFGDGGNDINMLRYVPMGVAMGNATDEVKAAANYVTDTVDNDGVEKAFRFLGI